VPSLAGESAFRPRPAAALERSRGRDKLCRMGSFNVALLEALLSVGVAPERARAVVDLFDRSVDERYGLHAQVLATRRDVAELEVRLAREISGVQAGVTREVAGLRAELTREVAGLRAELTREIAGTKVELVRWGLAALTAQTALLLGAMKLL